MAEKRRIKSLDFLRGIAITGVLFRHSELTNVLSRAGWSGVDLFFVLSGFLVSGLLFEEFKTTGKVNPLNFLIRRGFKIYPSFYIFITISILSLHFIFHEIISCKEIIGEVLFIQNYFSGVWWHTWSLDIEEHFYFFLVCFIFISIKFKFLQNPTVILPSLILMMVLIFLFRFQYAYAERAKENVAFFQTHLRSDGLILGVIISWLYHFSERFRAFISTQNKVLITTAFIFILPVFILEGGSFFMNTFGYNLLHIGFGILTITSLNKNIFSFFLKFRLTNSVFKVFCFVGLHSYSIYLWHAFVQYLFFKNPLPCNMHVVLYFIVSIAVGILFSLSIEKYFLNIRNRFFRAYAKG